MEPIKEAFNKIKEDIFTLKEALLELKYEIDQLKDIQTNQQTNTKHLHSTNKPTLSYLPNPIKLPLEDLYKPNNAFSTGNEGVPTNKPTNQQTNKHPPISYGNSPIDDFKQVNFILESLDDLKKGIRAKFKRLTSQEMIVFSTIYTLEDQKYPEITYKTLAEMLKLSESSIRDYINKIIIKGIPLQKIKPNNKKVLLSISPDLKNVTTLATIISLRDI